MSEILGENLSGKEVVGDDGGEIGMLYNITMDLASGELVDLVVDPHEDTSADYPMDEAGRYRVPVGNVQSVGDFVVVAR